MCCPGNYRQINLVAGHFRSDVAEDVGKFAGCFLDDPRCSTIICRRLCLRATVPEFHPGLGERDACEAALADNGHATDCVLVCCRYCCCYRCWWATTSSRRYINYIISQNDTPVSLHPSSVRNEMPMAFIGSRVSGARSWKMCEVGRDEYHWYHRFRRRYINYVISLEPTDCKHQNY